jgi:hypothetical protein
LTLGDVEGDLIFFCPFLVTHIPKHLPNRADLSRFLDRFDALSARSVLGRLCKNLTINIAGHAPLLRNSSGEHHDGGAGTSI